MLRLKALFTILVLAAAIALMPASRNAAPKENFAYASSIYLGWMPLGWAADNGIVKKWTAKYSIRIDDASG